MQSVDVSPEQRGHHISITSPFDLSIEEMINPASAQTPFGIKEYRPPKIALPRVKVHGAKWGKQKNTSFTESVIKQKGMLPSPDKYTTQANWTNAIPGRKGKFLKSPRTLIAQQIMKNKHKTPGPGAYETLPRKRKISGCAMAKEPKICAFIETATFHAMEGQSPKYDLKTRLTKPKILETTIYKPRRERFPKLEKREGEPSPGDYNVETAFARTQWHHTAWRFDQG